MRKNRLIALIGTLTMAAVGFAAVSVNSNKTSEVHAGDADTKGVYFYFKPNSSWKQANAQFKMTFKWGDPDESINMTNISGTDYYYAVSNKTHYDIEVERWSEGYGTKWNTLTGLFYQSSTQYNTFEQKSDDWTTDCNWYKKQATVSYDKNGGSGTLNNVNYTNPSTFTLPSSSSLTKSGFNLVGWEIGGVTLDCGGSYNVTAAHIVGNTSLQFKAVWEAQAADTFTVTYNSNGGTGSTKSFSTEVGDDATILAYNSSDLLFTAPSKKVFKEWNTQADGQGSSYTTGSTVSLGKDAELELFAIWKDYDITDGYYVEFFDAVRSPQRVKLTWNEQTGTSSQHIAMNVSLNAGEKFKIVEYCDQVIVSGHYYGTEQADPKTGAATTEGQLYQQSTTEPVNTNFVVRVSGSYDIYFNDQYADYKVWIPANEYTVTYHANYGSAEPVPQTCYVYDNQTETGRSFAEKFQSNTFAAPDSTKIFDGWTTVEGGTTKTVSVGDSIPTAAEGANLDYYAVWRDKNPQDGYYVKVFHSTTHAGNYAMALKQGSETEYVTTVTLDANEEFKIVYYDNEVIDSSTGYHGYSEFKYGPGSAREAGQIIEDSAEHNLKVKTAGTYKIYYDTVGSQISGSGDYHIWIPAVVDVTFDMNGFGGTAPDAQQVGNGDTISQPSAPEISDYTFDGWYTESTCTNEWNFSTALNWTSEGSNYEHNGSTGICSKTLYAHYTEDVVNYDVSFGVNNASYGSISPSATISVASGTSYSISNGVLTIGETSVIPTPTISDAQYTYAFDKWTINGADAAASGTITAVSSFVANFVCNTNTYALDVDWDSDCGTVEVIGDLDEIPYGTVITQDQDDPEYLYIGSEEIILCAEVNEDTVQYDYEFTGWTFTSPVTGAQTITANFTRETQKYDILWVDYDETTVLEEDNNVPFGTTPSYDGETPTREGDAQFSYEFTGWSPAIHTVDGDEMYVAQYAQTVNKYTVTWKNYDGTVLETDTNVPYGATPSYDDATPTKPSTAQYDYTFTGWSPTVSTVTGNAEYVAQFSETVRKYTVVWKNYDGTVLETDTNVAYGATPSYDDATPTKPSTAQYDYTFTGWSPTVSTVTGNAEYVAQFEEVTRKYTVTFQNYDGTELQSSDVAYGSVPSYTGETPTKPATDDYTYTFAGWDKQLVEVTGAATYTATFNEVLTSLGKAKQFADFYLTEIEKVCILEEDEKGDIEVKTVLSDLQAKWSVLEAKYDEIIGDDVDAQNYLKNASPVSESTNSLEKFASSYDYVYWKYGASLGSYGGNFAERNVKAQSGSRLLSINNVSTSTWIIAAVAIIGIAAVGVFFIYRKRKEI